MATGGSSQVLKNGGPTMEEFDASEEWPRWLVTAGIKMCKIAEMELTHAKAMASSADTLQRCRRDLANGGNDERDLRAERSGVFDPRDRPGVGHIAQHGTSVPEVAGGDGAQASAAAVVTNCSRNSGFY